MIGVVGPRAEAESLAAALDGMEVLTGGAEEVVDADPDVVAAVGEPAVRALVRADVHAPVMPVEAGEGLESIPADRARAVLGPAAEGRVDVREYPVLEVGVGDEAVGRGLFDAMLVTSEPARISEYAVETPEGADRFRADGVVVATPAGSRGYARAVGGPVLDHGSSSLVVVPVAAFTLRSTVRVVSTGATLALHVERDEGDIALLVDGEALLQVPPRQPVSVRVAGAVEIVVSPDPSK